MRQTTREFTVVGAWPKGITVGNWREAGCAAQSLIHSVAVFAHSYTEVSASVSSMTVRLLIASIALNSACSGSM